MTTYKITFTGKKLYFQMDKYFCGSVEELKIMFIFPYLSLFCVSTINYEPISNPSAFLSDS